jgi:hypothetical protein
MFVIIILMLLCQCAFIGSSLLAPVMVAWTVPGPCMGANRIIILGDVGRLHVTDLATVVC